MKHYLLAVLALYTAILVHFPIARYVEAQSGGHSGDHLIVPGDALYDDMSERYEEMMEMARNASVQQLFSNDVQAGGSGTAPSGSIDGFCGLYFHGLRLLFRGCETTYYALSCSGRCQTEQRPRSFTRR